MVTTSPVEKFVEVQSISSRDITGAKHKADVGLGLRGKATATRGQMS